MQTYTSASGFTMQYPVDWEVQENAYGSLAMFLSPQTTGDTFREFVAIVTETLPVDISADEYYTQLAKPQMEEAIQNFKEISNENITIDGVAAKKIVYEGTQSNYNLKRKQVVLIKNKMAYIINYSAFADTFASFSTVADDMMNSLAIK